MKTVVEWLVDGVSQRKTFASHQIANRFMAIKAAAGQEPRILAASEPGGQGPLHEAGGCIACGGTRWSTNGRICHACQVMVQLS